MSAPLAELLTLALSSLIGVSVAEAQESGGGVQRQTDSDESIIEQADEDLRLWESRRIWTLH